MGFPGGTFGIELTYPYPVAAFADAVLGELARRGRSAAGFDEVGFVVTLADDRRLLVDRLFYDLQNLSGEARARQLAAGLEAALRPMPASWPEVQPLLRSVLRATSFTGAVAVDGNLPWIRPLWPFVQELAVVDSGAVRAVVTQGDTARWGVGGEQMFAAAHTNIAARYPPQPQTQRIGHLRGDGHSYCDSAVLVPGWLSSFADGSAVRPVVFFPGDEVLLVCTDDPGAAGEFFAAAERLYRQAAVPISPQGYTIVGRTLIGLDAAGPSGLRPPAVRARSVLAEREYLVQGQRLQQYFAQTGTDAEAAPLQMIETPRGSCTMTVWRQGTPGLLPAADYLTLLPADQSRPVTVPFPVLADVLGWQPEADLVPLRFAAERWPDDQTLGVLRAHAVALPGI